MKLWRWCALGLTGAVLLGAGVAGAEETLKIGVLAPLTGFAAADGLSVKNAVELATEQVNAKGGVLGKKLELVIYDDAADPKESVTLAQKLIEQDQVVAGVGGSYSMPTRVTTPIFNEEEVPMVAAYAIHPDVTEGEFTFRNGFLGKVEGGAAAHVVDTMLKGKKVALLYADNDFGKTLAQGFKDYVAAKGTLQVIFEQAYPAKEKDFSPYLSKIKEGAPDVLVAFGYYFQTGPVVKQAREMGITATILGEEGADSPKLFEIAGPASEGFVLVTNLNRDDPRPVVQEFLKSFREKYAMEPDMVGASAYDALMIIVDAITRSGGTDRKAVRDAIAAVKNYDGLTGIIQGFTEVGEVVKPVQVQVVKDGKFTYMGVVDDLKLIQP